jgi:lipoprotein-releasing system permease protein
MNGFEQELRTRILGVASHATISGLEGNLSDWRQQLLQARSVQGVVAVAPYVEDQGLLASATPQAGGAGPLGTVVRGIDPAAEVTVGSLGEHLTAGSLAALQPGAWRVVLGKQLAEELQVKVGDRVVLVVPRGTATPAGVVPRLRRLTVAGIFDVGMYEYDRGLVLLNLQDAARLYQLGDAVTGLRLALDDPFQAGSRVHEVAVALGGGVYVSDWSRKHANFFRSIQVTKGILFVILLLVVGVAAFNIVATLVMVVKEKGNDIAILRTLGATPAAVLRTFMLHGFALGAMGTAAGVLCGMLLAWNIGAIVHGLEWLLGTTLVDGRVYLIGDLPSRIIPGEVLSVALVALALATLSTLYPAWRASRLAPAQALRQE